MRMLKQDKVWLVCLNDAVLGVLIEPPTNKNLSKCSQLSRYLSSSEVTELRKKQRYTKAGNLNFRLEVHGVVV